MVGRLVRVMSAAHDAQIEPGSTNVLADLIDQENIGRRERHARHPSSGLHEQRLFPLFESLGRHGLDPRRPSPRVFDDGEAGENRASRS